MKKLVASAAVAALLGSVAMADVHVGLEGDANLNIGNARNKDNDGTSVQATVGRDWRDSNGIRTKLITNASNEYVGGEFIFCRDSSIGGDTNFVADKEGDNVKGVKHEGGDLAWIDGAKIWWTPVEQFKLWVGQGTHDDIRGNAGYGANGFCTPLNAGEYKDGWTFMGQGVRGVSVGVFPVKGLSLYGSWEVPMGRERDYRYDWDNGDKSFRSEPQNIFGRQAKYCAAYEIEGIGAVKVGLDECVPSAKDKDGNYKSQNIISASVEVKAVDNFFFAVGAFIPTVQYSCDNERKTTGSFNPDEWYGHNRNAFNRINAYARYTISDGFNIHAKVGTLLNSPDVDRTSGEKVWKEKDGQFGFYVGAGVDYPIMDTVKLNLNTSYANGIYLWNSSAKHMDCFDVALTVAKEFPNCCVSVGFAGSTTTRIENKNEDGSLSTRHDVHAMYDTTYKNSNGELVCPFNWGVPLHIAFWF